MLKNLKKRSEGFTIIEVLIVLAIAGLILLIVFLAIPALQRNNRNTQRKNFVSSALGALQEVTNNNNGVLTTTATTTQPAQLQAVSGVYAGQIDYSVVPVGTAGAALTAAQPVIQAQIRNGYKCNAAYNGSITATTANFAGIAAGNAATNPVTTTQATARNIVVLYGVETNNNTYQLLCQES